jgi:hypothetical protein
LNKTSHRVVVYNNHNIIAPQKIFNWHIVFRNGCNFIQFLF